MTPFEAMLRSLVEVGQWILVFALALKVILLDRRLYRLETNGVKVRVAIERVDGSPRAPASKIGEKSN